MNSGTPEPRPERSAAPAGEIPYLRLPGRDLFSRRASRFMELAKDHPLENYLEFLGLLAGSQQDALDRLPVPLLPAPGELARCREQGLPPLDVRSLPRDQAWRSVLDMILGRMREASLPSTARETLTFLGHADEAGLERKAGRLLAGNLAMVPPREFPFLAAALQVCWLGMASSLDDRVVERQVVGGMCPVCGSLPNAGIVRSGGADQGLRYLCCSLCSSQWHMVRIKCSCCESTGRIDYYALENSDGAVKAESCEDCGTYLKLLYLEKDGRMEAMADDLATLGLDLLMENEGKSRVGPNLFYHPGKV